MQEFYLVDVKNKITFLIEILKIYQSQEALLSLEGDLQPFDFIEDIFYLETPILHRHTLLPILDFVVFPLTKQNVQQFCAQLSLNPNFLEENIIHLQIEVKGQLMLGAYDQFHPECTILSTMISSECLEAFKQQNIIIDYKVQ